MLPRNRYTGLILMALVVAALVVTFAAVGCAPTYSGPCLRPETAFARYVARELDAPEAETLGECQHSYTEDTGDPVTTCEVFTSAHGRIHKRLIDRSCWRL